MPNNKFVVVNVFLGKGLGGIEKSFVDYIRYYQQLGYTSKAIVGKNSKIITFVPHGVEVIELSNFAEWDLWASFKLANALKKIKANIVIIHGRRASKICRFVYHIPQVGVAHNYSLKYLLSLDYIFTITDDIKKQLLNMGYDKAKMFDMPHMIDVPSERQKQVISNPITIGAIGRLVPEKGFDLLLDALKILKDKNYKFKLFLAGDGIEKEKLEKQVKDLSLEKEVSMLGWVTNIADYYKRVNILCIPSRKESFGLVLIEAFAYGKAVVSSGTKGPLQIGENNKDTLFFAIENVKQLALKLEALLQDQALIVKMGDAGYKKVKENYDIKKGIKKFEQVANKIIKT